MMLANQVPLAVIVKGTNIKKVVDNPEWQTLRLWLKGKWNNRGLECVQAMEKYYQVDPQDPWRIRRLLNYLTCSGFRTGAIKESSVDSLREVVRNQWAKLLGEEACHKLTGKI